MITSMRLVDGDQEMILIPRAGLKVQSHDVPYPDVRERVEPRTDDDGVRDTTSLHGATSCTLEMLAEQTPEAVRQELDAFLRPTARPYLVVADDEWSGERRLMLRVSQRTAPRGIDLPRTMRRIQAQWRVPDGLWEAVDQTTATVSADVPASTGMSFPVTFPMEFAATMSVGTQIVTNPGNMPAHFIARLYGPCTGPMLQSQTLGAEIAFTSDLVLAAGEYVEIDTRDKTALLNGGTVSRLNQIDFASTTWWRLEPGTNQIRYAPTSASAGSAAVIEYRPAWL